MKKEDVLKMMAEDEFGLLMIKPQNTAITADDRLTTSFEEINTFVMEQGREPKIGGEIHEHRLATRLQSLRADTKKSASLLEFDRYHLLPVEQKELNSVHDLFANDDLGILENEDENLFQLQHVPEYKERESTDFVARRKSCKDFAKYEKVFQACQKDLASGKRKLLKFNEKHIHEGSLFVMNGILLLVEKIFERKKDKNSKMDGRIRCIFENGTESNMLFRSLGKGLYDNGQTVSETLDSDEIALLENFNTITEEDEKTGFIYVLRSKSQDPKIQSIENLYKIGFSTTPVEDRIKNALEDPTYLMAPVSIVTTFECYNLNPQKLELLLHTFFGSTCLNFDIFDKKGQRHTPREWFIAPLDIIEKSIKLIISGEIVNYQYNREKLEIIKKGI